MVSVHAAIGHHASESWDDADRHLRFVLGLAREAISIHAGRSPRFVHMFLVRIFGADGHRYLFPRTELDFLLVAIGLAQTLMP